MFHEIDVNLNAVMWCSEFYQQQYSMSTVSLVTIFNSSSLQQEMISLLFTVHACREFATLCLKSVARHNEFASPWVCFVLLAQVKEVGSNDPQLSSWQH